MFFNFWVQSKQTFDIVLPLHLWYLCALPLPLCTETACSDIVLPLHLWYARVTVCALPAFLFCLCFLYNTCFAFLLCSVFCIFAPLYVLRICRVVRFCLLLFAPASSLSAFLLFPLTSVTEFCLRLLLVFSLCYCYYIVEKRMTF